MAWWNMFFGGNKEEFSSIKADAPQEIAGLNVKTAIEAHVKWKQRLKEVVDGTGSEVLDPYIVARDDQCQLGKWLHSEGRKQFGAHPGFMPVVTSHARFHRCAGHTLQLALDGKAKEAEAELTSGEFASASLDVSTQLMRLWRDAGSK